jgi:hypothetical protein
MGLGALDLFHIVNQIRNTYVIENIGLIILKQPLSSTLAISTGLEILTKQVFYY